MRIWVIILYWAIAKCPCKLKVKYLLKTHKTIYFYILCRSTYVCMYVECARSSRNNVTPIHWNFPRGKSTRQTNQRKCACVEMKTQKQKKNSIDTFSKFQMWNGLAFILIIFHFIYYKIVLSANFLTLWKWICRFMRRQEVISFLIA